jgi:GNAT superfamily N-acetyltransferase
MPTRTYLEQTRAGDLRSVASPGEDVTVLQVEDCVPSLWRQLYSEVGAAYHWVDRLGWTDADIRAYLSDPAVSLWVLSVKGEVAGYFELRQHPDDEVRLKPDTPDDHLRDPVASGVPPPPEASARLAEARFAREGGGRTLSVEIAYFGLLPAYVGRGLGKYLLSEAAARAWTLQPSRVWLHTSTLDHPAALPNYLARGFSISRVEQY